MAYYFCRGFAAMRVARQRRDTAAEAPLHGTRELITPRPGGVRGSHPF